MRRCAACAASGPMGRAPRLTCAIWNLLILTYALGKDPAVPMICSRCSRTSSSASRVWRPSVSAWRFVGGGSTRPARRHTCTAGAQICKPAACTDARAPSFSGRGCMSCERRARWMQQTVRNIVACACAPGTRQGDACLLDRDNSEVATA